VESEHIGVAPPVENMVPAPRAMVDRTIDIGARTTRPGLLRLSRVKPTAELER